MPKSSLRELSGLRACSRRLPAGDMGPVRHFAGAVLVSLPAYQFVRPSVMILVIAFHDNSLFA
jgi:hypothetical protein